MKKAGFILGLIFCLSIVGLNTNAQRFIDKLKKKTEDKVVDQIFGEDEKNADGDSRSGNDNYNYFSSTNKKGGGLNAREIDVNENIGLASSSFSNKDYSDARYAVREAILGIEMEIGKNILEDLPGSVNNLPAVKDEDNVTSSGIGFVGMIISRTYRENDKEFRVTVGNDGGMLSAVNMYFAAGYSSTSTDENVQRTKFKDEPAVIEYDEYSGYKLSVPFGQSSILVTEGVNFENQDEFMSASENIDLEKIKNQLGEQ